MAFSPSVKHNSIEIITGCMFSGKTEELIRRINIARAEGLITALFKPQIDNRYHSEFIVSHNGKRIESFAIHNSSEILNQIGNVDVVGIDEAQFFDNDIIDLCQHLVSKKIRVIIAGLDTDFIGNPFGPMPNLINISNNITMLNAVCHQCGGPATLTFKKTKSNAIIEIGENDIYEARCLKCYQMG